MTSELSLLCHHHLRERNEGYQGSGGSSRWSESGLSLDVYLCMRSTTSLLTEKHSCFWHWNIHVFESPGPTIQEMLRWSESCFPSSLQQMCKATYLSWGVFLHYMLSSWFYDISSFVSISLYSLLYLRGSSVYFSRVPAAFMIISMSNQKKLLDRLKCCHRLRSFYFAWEKDMDMY